MVHGIGFDSIGNIVKFGEEYRPRESAVAVMSAEATSNAATFRVKPGQRNRRRIPPVSAAGASASRRNQVSSSKIARKGKHSGLLVLRRAWVVDANLASREVNLAPQQRQPRYRSSSPSRIRSAGAVAARACAFSLTVSAATTDRV